MSRRGRAAAAAATAAVYIGNVRVGSTVLVDQKHLVTARHALTTSTGLLENVGVRFPGRDGLRMARVAAVPELDDDILVLELGRNDATHLPEPMELWASGRAPERVAVFGFPAEDAELAGVWREFETAGPVKEGAEIQLRWLEDTGTLPGHSGGAVLDAASGTLAGVLVAGSERGRFDRYVSVRVAQRLWPVLPRPWLVVAADGRDHFERRASGQRSMHDPRKDLFRGRATALEVAQRWMLDPDPPGVPLVITGQPGAGKSALLARVALVVLESRCYGPGLAFHARGTTHEELVDALGALSGAEARPTRLEVLEALTKPPDGEGTCWYVAVDALDEASSNLIELSDMLREIAQLPSVRLMVATRRRGVNDTGRVVEASAGDLLGRLAANERSLINLDAPHFFDPEGLLSYVEELLQQQGPPGRAWQAYEADARLRSRLAEMITRRAGRNYLVAVMAAEPLHLRSTIVDPDDPVFDPIQVPSSVGGALESYLDSLPTANRAERRGALTRGFRGAGADTGPVMTKGAPDLR